MMNRPEPPRSLVLEQWPAISGMSAGLLRSFVPGAIKNRLVDPHKTYRASATAGSERLIQHYIDWCGVSDDQRYQGLLPAHFFSKYGMNMLARLTSLVPYNMLNVLNQGCHIQVNALLPRHEPLQLEGRLVECRRDGKRVRIHTRVTVGSASCPQAMSVDTMAAVMLGKQPKSNRERPAEPEWETIDEWSCDRHDGQRFFLLTGDFNPIHTFWPMAKRTRFGGCILHGFGSLARSWESIQNQGVMIRDFDTRFVKPHKLPSGPNKVQIAAPNPVGRTPMRLINAEGEVMLAGSYLSQ